MNWFRECRRQPFPTHPIISQPMRPHNGHQKGASVTDRATQRTTDRSAYSIVNGFTVIPRPTDAWNLETTDELVRHTCLTLPFPRHDEHARRTTLIHTHRHTHTRTHRQTHRHKHTSTHTHAHPHTRPDATTRFGVAPAAVQLSGRPDNFMTRPLTQSNLQTFFYPSTTTLYTGTSRLIAWLSNLEPL